MVYKKALWCTGFLLLTGSIWAGKDYYTVEYKSLGAVSADHYYTTPQGLEIKKTFNFGQFGPGYVYVWRQKAMDYFLGPIQEKRNKLYNCLYGPTIWSHVEYVFKRSAINYIQEIVGIDKATGKINMSDNDLEMLIGKLWDAASRKMFIQCLGGARDAGGSEVGKFTRQENLTPGIPVFSAPESARKKC